MDRAQCLGTVKSFPSRMSGGWRRPLFFGVCDFPKGLVGADAHPSRSMADEQELHLLPEPLEPSDKTTAKTLGEEKGRGPIGAGGDELQLSRAVRALIERHDAGEYTRDKAPPGESPFGRSQTLKSERLRQPAQCLGTRKCFPSRMSAKPPKLFRKEEFDSPPAERYSKLISRFSDVRQGANVVGSRNPQGLFSGSH